MPETTEIEIDKLYGVPESETVLGSPTLPDTRTEGWIIMVVFAIVYAAIGYFTVVNGHIVQFNALARLSDAYMVWWNAPPKLAAIGLNLAPMGTLAFLPLTLIKPLATSLIALPIVSVIAGGATLTMLNTLMARCELGGGVRYPTLLLFGLNPMFVFCAINGSPEMLGMLMVAAALMALASWRIMDETRYLVGAGMAIGVAVLVAYTFLLWALGIFLAIVFVGPGSRGGQAKLRSSMLLFLTPVVYSILVWTVLSALILESPFNWVTTGADQVTTNLTSAVAQGPASLGPALGNLAEVVLGIAPLAFLVLPLLLVSVFTRRDSLASGLIAVLLLAGAAIVGGALLEDKANLVSLGQALPIAVAAVAGAAWLYRGEDGWRFIVGTIMVAVLALAIPLSWNAMRNYQYQDQAQAFTRFVETRDSQEGTSSIGGYRVGIDPELAMADFINNRLKPAKDSILTDSSVTYGVILLSGRPDRFVDRADLTDGEWLALRENPYGKVDYMLVATHAREDLLRSRYTDLELGVQPALVPVFHTDRYVLVRVGRSAPTTSESGSNGPGRAQSQPQLVTPNQPAELPAEGPAVLPGLSPTSVRPAPTPLPSSTSQPAQPSAEGGRSSAPTVVGE